MTYKEISIPAGTYYIGDPSYVLTNKLFDELVDVVFELGNEPGDELGKFILSNGVPVTYTLIPANGVFRTSHGATICVDSLIVAAIPADACGDGDPADNGIVTKFRFDTTAMVFDNGDCAFGKVVVFAAPTGSWNEFDAGVDLFGT